MAVERSSQESQDSDQQADRAGTSRRLRAARIAGGARVPEVRRHGLRKRSAAAARMSTGSVGSRAAVHNNQHASASGPVGQVGPEAFASRRGLKRKRSVVSEKQSHRGGHVESSGVPSKIAARERGGRRADKDGAKERRRTPSPAKAQAPATSTSPPARPPKPAYMNHPDGWKNDKLTSEQREAWIKYAKNHYTEEEKKEVRDRAGKTDRQRDLLIRLIRSDEKNKERMLQNLQIEPGEFDEVWVAGAAAQAAPVASTSQPKVSSPVKQSQSGSGKKPVSPTPKASASGSGEEDVWAVVPTDVPTQEQFSQSLKIEGEFSIPPDDRKAGWLDSISEKNNKVLEGRNATVPLTFHSHAPTLDRRVIQPLIDNAIANCINPFTFTFDMDEKATHTRSAPLLNCEVADAELSKLYPEIPKRGWRLIRYKEKRKELNVQHSTQMMRASERQFQVNVREFVRLLVYRLWDMRKIRVGDSLMHYRMRRLVGAHQRAGPSVPEASNHAERCLDQVTEVAQCASDLHLLLDRDGIYAMIERRQRLLSDAQAEYYLNAVDHLLRFEQWHGFLRSGALDQLSEDIFAAYPEFFRDPDKCKKAFVGHAERCAQWLQYWRYVLYWLINMCRKDYKKATPHQWKNTTQPGEPANTTRLIRGNKWRPPASPPASPPHGSGNGGKSGEKNASPTPPGAVGGVSPPNGN